MPRRVDRPDTRAVPTCAQHHRGSPDLNPANTSFSSIRSLLNVPIVEGKLPRSSIAVHRRATRMQDRINSDERASQFIAAGMQLSVHVQGEVTIIREQCGKYCPRRVRAPITRIDVSVCCQGVGSLLNVALGECRYICTKLDYGKPSGYYKSRGVDPASASNRSSSLSSSHRSRGPPPLRVFWVNRGRSK